jgi:hypothetical protein
VQLSVLKGGSNKVLAAAQRGGLLFTHKVCAFEPSITQQRLLHTTKVHNLR